MLNTMIVSTLCGLWHGANWTYVSWGFYAGVIIATNEPVFQYKDIMPLKKADRGRYRLLRHHLNLIVAMVPFCCQMNGSPEAREGMNEFFKRCKEQYPEQYRMVKSPPVISLMRAPGETWQMDHAHHRRHRP